MQGSRLMGQEITAMCSTKDSWSKSPPSLALAEQLPRLVPPVASQSLLQPSEEPWETPARPALPPPRSPRVQEKLFLPWLPQEGRGERSGEGKEADQVLAVPNSSSGQQCHTGLVLSTDGDRQPILLCKHWVFWLCIVINRAKKLHSFSAGGLQGEDGAGHIHFGAATTK